MLQVDAVCVICGDDIVETAKVVVLTEKGMQIRLLFTSRCHKLYRGQYAIGIRDHSTVTQSK